MDARGWTICVAIALVACLQEVSSKGQLGDKCNQDWECRVVGSSCQGGEGRGYCQCKATHLEYNGLCVVEFGNRCYQQLDTCKGTNVKCCLSGGSGSFCMCFANSTLHSPPDTCKLKLGFDCTKTDECAAGECTNSLCGIKDSPGVQGSCRRARCTCTEPGLVPTKDMTKCLPDLDAACSRECADRNAACTEGICSCKKEYVKDDSELWKQECKKRLGVPCDYPEECADEHSTCARKSRGGHGIACVCQDGFVGKEDRSGCLPVAANVGSPCEENLQCQVKLGVDSECNEEKKCACKNKFEFDEDKGICT